MPVNNTSQRKPLGHKPKGARIPEVVNRNGILEVLKLSGAKFDRLLRDGAPVGNASDGSMEVNIADFVAFMIKDAVSKATAGESDGATYEQAKRKDKTLQASLRELDLLKRQGDMVDVEDVRPVVREVFATVRSRMLSVRSQVQGLTPEQSRQVDDAVNDALTELSSGGNLNFGDDAKAAQQPKH